MQLDVSDIKEIIGQVEDDSNLVLIQVYRSMSLTSDKMVAFIGKSKEFKECIGRHGTKYQDKVLIVEVKEETKRFIKQNM